VEQLLEEQVGELLRQRGLKLVLAESCTGGRVSDRITNVPGSSDYYLGGVTAYAYEVKEQLLGVSPQTLAEFGAVSRECVQEMARGARMALAIEFPLERLVSISISGIAGPGGGTLEKPVGLVWIGLSAADGAWAWRFQFDGDRIQVKEQSAQEALRCLNDYLRGQISAKK